MKIKMRIWSKKTKCNKCLDESEQKPNEWKQVRYNDVEKQY